MGVGVGLGREHLQACGKLWEKLYLLHIWWFLKCCICLSGGKETQHDVWKYNSSINKWIQIEYLNIGRWRHKMVVLGGKVYVLGGFDGLQRINNVETYDPFHNCWSEVKIISMSDSVWLLQNLKKKIKAICQRRYTAF